MTSISLIFAHVAIQVNLHPQCALGNSADPDWGFIGIW